MKTAEIALGLIIIIAVPASSPAAESGPHARSSVRKTTGSPIWTKLNINYLSANINAAGLSDINTVNPGLPGLIYPKGSGKGPVSAAGPLWAAHAGPGGDIRASGAVWYYLTSLAPGKILDSLKPESPDLPKNRVYRVRRDIPPENQSADVSSEQIDGEGSPQSIYDQYHKDWNDWPWQDGAPFEDKNHNGIYEPAIDVPGFPGADQTIWCVSNDVAESAQLFGTPPLGIELQTTVWGYRSEGALGHTIFRRYVLINRNTISFDSMYVSMWADPDIGYYGDDLAGCDTTRSLGFAYNGEETDKLYDPLPPPAYGFDFFQGPSVPGAPTDSGIFKGRRVYGKRNLPMTAFFANTENAVDPMLKNPLDFGGPDGLIMMYNNLRGLTADNGKPYIDPLTGMPTKFPFAGDPEKRTGWLDGTHGLTFGDRHIGIASGPFTMAKGDTQEIVVAEMCAGAIPGVDRLSAIGLLKFYDDQAQAAYDNFFAVPQSPDPPTVVVSPMSQEIVLNWGIDSTDVAKTEVPAPLGYAFEGYNVYQLPSASASLTEGKRVATFDVINGVGKILDMDFDPVQGSVLQQVKEYGTDSGIQRWIHIATDRFRNDAPLINGNPYYFAVTAYNYNPAPGIVPATKESFPSIITIVPHAPDPGTRYAGHFGDTIAPVVHTTVPTLTPSDGVVAPIIIDPSKLTGHQYSVSFDTAAGSVSWNLTDMTTGTVKLARQTNQSGDQHYPFVDGIQTFVTGPSSPSWRDWQIPSGKCRFTWSGADAYELEGFNGAMGNAADFFVNVLGFQGGGIPHSRLKSVLLRLAPAKADGTFPAGDQNLSYAYRYLRGAQNPPARPEFAQFIKNTSGSYAFQDYVQGVPFSAWNVDVNPPQRLAVAFLENNVAAGRVDGKWWPDTAGVDNCSGTGPREWFWILDAPYTDAAANPAFETNAQTDPSIPFMWISLANRLATVDWANGDEFLIRVNHLNCPGNTFAFTAPTNVVGSAALARNDVSLINVFPNPYYGVNPQEINKYERFVTFSHLPKKAVIRIFNLAGIMVRRIDRERDSQFEHWDLKNDSGLPVGSGLYIAHIDMPDLGVTKILKIAVVQEQQILDRF